MKQFEYCCKDEPWPPNYHEMESLKIMGEAGWELCAATPIQWYIRYYFKREVTPKEPINQNQP